MERINKIISTAIEKSEDSKFILGFIEGAKWADNHPVNVWHDASEEPLKYTAFLAELEVGEFQTFVLDDTEFNWNELVGEICILRWAYISDLLM